MYVTLKPLSAGKFELQRCDPWKSSEVLHTFTISDIIYVWRRISETQITGTPCTSISKMWLNNIKKKAKVSSWNRIMVQLHHQDHAH